MHTCRSRNIPSRRLRKTCASLPISMKCSTRSWKSLIAAQSGTRRLPVGSCAFTRAPLLDTTFSHLTLSPYRRERPIILKLCKKFYGDPNGTRSRLEASRTLPTDPEESGFVGFSNVSRPPCPTLSPHVGCQLGANLGSDSELGYTQRFESVGILLAPPCSTCRCRWPARENLQESGTARNARVPAYSGATDGAAMTCPPCPRVI